MKARLKSLEFKMLRKRDDGNIEEYYTDNIQEKKLFDTEAKMKRRINTMSVTETGINNHVRKQDLQARQKAARDLRSIKSIIAERGI